MNSAPVMDSPAAKVAADPQLPTFAAAKLKGDKPTAKGGLGSAATEVPPAFGEVLEKASAKASKDTADSTDTDNIAAAPADPGDSADPLLPNEEPVKDKKDEKTSPNVLPLICFCPPPEIQTPPPPLAPPTQPVSDLVTETPVQPAPAQTQVPPPAIEIKSAELQSNQPETQSFEPEQPDQPSDLVKTVSPKEKSDKPTPKFSAAKTDSPKAIELDPKIFKPVPEKLAQVTLPELPKPLPAARPETPPITHGTLAAQQANAMKNGAKTAEITPAIEQKMPVQGGNGRAATLAPTRRAAVTRLDDSGLISSAPARISTDFKLEAPAETIPVKPSGILHLVESIRTEIAHIRQLSQSTMSLVLKPDNGTELKLEVSIARDGTIQAQARCERGDFQTLNAQWPQLQQSLAAHGIQMTNLSNTGNQNQQQHSSENHGNFAGSQNFDRGNQSQNRQQQPAHTFEEELATTTPRFPTPKTFKQPATGTTRRWQSWA